MSRGKASAKSVATANEDKPIIDFSGLSYQDATAMNRIEANIQRTQILAERLKRKGDDVSDAAIDELMVLTHPDKLDEAADAVRHYMARVVRYVPRSWFVEDAPDELDFGDPDTYLHLRMDKTARLRNIIRLAQVTDEAAKN